MKVVAEKLYSLIRYSICGEALPAGISFSENDKKAVVSIARAHDIAAIVAYALDKNGFLDKDADEDIKDEELFAQSRVTTLEFFAEEVYSTFEKYGIDYLPLKGSLIRKFYPKAYFRTSTDVDVLVRKEDFIKAERLLKTELKLKEKQRTEHDVALSRSFLETVELHHSLVEEGKANGADEVLDNVWSHASSLDGRRYELDEEYFVFYHIAHTMKHFGLGGCGLRFFIDIGLIAKDMTCNERLKTLIDRADMGRFFSRCIEFSEYVMKGGEKTKELFEFEDYVFCSGAFGSIDNKAITETKSKGKGLKYLRKRIFLSYDELSMIFPKLKGKRILKPLYQVRRWFALFSKSRLKRNLAEMKGVANVDPERAKRVEKLFADLGIEE